MSLQWWEKYEFPILEVPEIDIKIVKNWEFVNNCCFLSEYKLYDYENNTWRKINVVSDGGLKTIDFNNNFLGGIDPSEAKARIVQHCRENRFLES